MIKKVAILVLIVLLVVVLVRMQGEFETIMSDSKEYYLKETLTEVGSRNIVTGIYLDYRLFDSIFEAGILLVSVAGVIFMARKDESMIKGYKNERK